MTPTAGDDTLIGGNAADTFDGLAGNDLIQGNTGNDTLKGGEGNDTLEGGRDNDRLEGGNGNDSLVGGSQNDTLVGGAGNDTLSGGSENDLLDGGAGADQQLGGSGDDVFIFNADDLTLVGAYNGGSQFDMLRFSGGLDFDFRDTIANRFANIEGIDLATDTGVNEIIFGTAQAVNYLNIPDVTYIDGGAGDIVRLVGGYTDTNTSQMFASKIYDVYTAGAGTVLVQQGVAVNLSLPPNAVNDTAMANENGPAVMIPVLANDTDPEMDPLMVTAVDTTGTLGLVTINMSGTISYNPNGQFSSLNNGQTATDTFAYTVSDGNGNTDTATVTVTINGVGSGPVANDDSAMTNEDTILPVIAPGVLGNDTDPNSDPLTVIGVNGVGNVGVQIMLASGALLIVNANGSYIYDPNEAFESLNAGDMAVDGFSYTVSDGNGGMDTGNVVINIAGVNDGGGPVGMMITGTIAPETLNGGAGNDTISGLGGNDTINGNAGNDNIDAGVGNDTVYGGADSDTVNGGTGNDMLSGDDGADVLNGNNGADALNGGAGNDTLNGGSGNDILTGGLGDDLFIASTGMDVIQDFTAGVGGSDEINVSGIFANFTAVQAATMDVGGSAVINLGTGTFTVLGVLEANLVASDFVF